MINVFQPLALAPPHALALAALRLALPQPKPLPVPLRQAAVGDSLKIPLAIERIQKV